ncbi:MAG: hypothetical protein AAF416_16265 [Pseudomonadota bacterium]
MTEPATFTERFAVLITRYIEAKGWTLKEVAHAVWGVNGAGRESHVSGYMKGTKGKPSKPTQDRFCKALGIPPEEIEACRAPPPPPQPAAEETHGLGHQLMAELARQFEETAKAEGVLGWTDWLREKAAEYRRLREEVEALRASDERLDNQLAEAIALMDAAHFAEADAILTAAKELSRDRARTALEQTSRFEQAQARLALLQRDAETASHHLIAACSLFDTLDPNHAIALRQKLGQETYHEANRTGGPGFIVAADIFRSITTIATETTRPNAWASAQNSLAIALKTQGQRMAGEAGSALLAEAVSAYRAALRVRTEKTHPATWAMIQNNLGGALRLQGTRTGGEAGSALLAEAVSACRAALRVTTEEAHPVDWARTQNNLGIALQVQGTRTTGEAGSVLLAEAVTAYRAALRVRTEETHPVGWAMTQNNLGGALEENGWRTGGDAGSVLLAEAVSAYRAALRVRTEEAMPLAWAETTVNLGLAFETLADLVPERAREHLEAAHSCFDDALRVLDPEHLVHDYDITTEVQARVAEKLAGLG